MTHAPDPDGVEVTWQGATLVLLPERALWWPAERALLVADPHFGKSATFRAHGIPLPSGVTADDLSRLDAAVRRTAAARLIVLGDFHHARAGRSARVQEELGAFRAAHASLDITLVRGNHDRHAGDPEASLRIACVPEPLVMAGFSLRHHPIEVAAAGGGEGGAAALPVIAGHVHPVAVLADATGLRHRAPCFHLTPRQLVLPAFGSFTGGHPIVPRPGDRVFVIGDGAVLEATA
jgi:DNA ligase-associated metallophosphoesterase